MEIRIPEFIMKEMDKEFTGTPLTTETLVRICIRVMEYARDRDGRCLYCGSVFKEEEVDCRNCGAPRL